MDSPIAAAKSGFREAFTLKNFFYIFFAIILANLVVNGLAYMFPENKFFNGIYRLFTNPVGFLAGLRTP